ncbi:hypothetical protein Kim5_PA00491 (plasmid) [Rhizobium sp. Kim5]|nr:hypothetical protein Kim5_PA00491 [Rhizobium sp. Kim5]
MLRITAIALMTFGLRFESAVNRIGRRTVPRRMDPSWATNKSPSSPSSNYRNNDPLHGSKRKVVQSRNQDKG